MSFHRDYDTMMTHWSIGWMSDVTFGGKYETRDISIGRFKFTLKGVKKFMKYIVKKNYTVYDDG